MRIKHLEASLSCLQREFDEPKIDLEQYPTCPELAASIMDMAVKRGDIGNPGQSCLDLGCGTGMLTVAAAFVVEEGEFVWGVDCDEDALTIARNNVDHVELEDCVKFIHAKVRMKEANLDGTDDNNKNVGGPHKKRGGRNSRDAGRGRVGRGGRGGAHNAASSTKSRLIHDKEDGVPLADNCVETVFTNPPFGTKNNAGIDVQFMRTATRLAKRAVYSFHKRSTRDFLLKTIRDDWGYPESEVVAEMSFDIPNSYKFHKSKTKDIEVDLIRICVVNRNDDNDAVGAVDVTVIDTIVEGSGCCDNDVNDGGNIEEDHHEIQKEEEGGTPKEI